MIDWGMPCVWLMTGIIVAQICALITGAIRITQLNKEVERLVEKRQRETHKIGVCVEFSADDSKLRASLAKLIPECEKVNDIFTHLEEEKESP